MIKINNVTMMPKYPDSIYIQWDVENPSLNTNYFFHVYLSDNPETVGLESNRLTAVPVLNAFFFEARKPVLAKQEYYYVQVKSLDDKGVTSLSDVASMTQSLPFNENLVVMDIIRRKDLVRKVFTGIPCILRKRRIIGKLCPICIDKGTQQVTNTQCPSCFGTRITGGYMDPIEVNCEIIEGPRDIKPTEIGTTENIDAIATLSFPLLFKGDVVIEKRRNKRWYVNRVEREMLQTYPIDQRIELRQISPKDIEYRL